MAHSTSVSSHSERSSPTKSPEWAFIFLWSGIGGINQFELSRFAVLIWYRRKDAEQLSMFVDHQKRDRRILLEDAVENIRRRVGKCAISYAILMGDLKIPDDGRQLVTMPGLMYQ